jgi:hypothetical protein
MARPPTLAGITPARERLKKSRARRVLSGGMRVDATLSPAASLLFRSIMSERGIGKAAAIELCVLAYTKL